MYFSGGEVMLLYSLLNEDVEFDKEYESACKFKCYSIKLGNSSKVTAARVKDLTIDIYNKTLEEQQI